MRSESFSAFDPIERVRWLRAIREFNVQGFTPEQLDRWEADVRSGYDSVLPRFAKKNGKPRDTWHGSKLRQMAREVDPDLENLYVYVFRDTSESVHPTSRDTRHYLHTGSGDTVSPVLDVSSNVRESADFVLFWTSFLTLHLLEHLNRALRLGHDGHIRQLDGRLSGILSRAKKA